MTRATPNGTRSTRLTQRRRRRRHGRDRRVRRRRRLVEGEWDEDESDDADQEDGEYDDNVADYDDEYDEGDEGDEDGDDGEDGDRTDGPAERFTPPTFLEAAKQAFWPKRLSRAGATGTDAADTTTASRGASRVGNRATPTSAGSGRGKAQPATGTEQDGKAVHLIDRREQTVGFVLGFGLVVLSLLAYNADRHYKNKDLVKQLAVRHAAGEVLAIFALLGLLTILATFFKRRALVGFVLAFGGLALLQTLGIFGIFYLGAGGWLIYRAMQRSPKSRARQAAAAGDSGRSGQRDLGWKRHGLAAVVRRKRQHDNLHPPLGFDSCRRLAEHEFEYPAPDRPQQPHERRGPPACRSERGPPSGGSRRGAVVLGPIHAAETDPQAAPAQAIRPAGAVQPPDGVAARVEPR